MKTLIKLSKQAPKASTLYGKILFDGNCARATDCESHAIIENGPWNFEAPAVVDIGQVNSAMALSKKPVWSGNTLNGVELTNTINYADFPTYEKFNGERINCEGLQVKLEKVYPAAAQSDIRYFLNGICFDHDAKKIIGCDGHRLHLMGYAYTCSTLKGQSIVPIDIIKLIGVKNIIHIDFNDTHCRIGYVGGYSIVRLVDGKFPDYSRVTPNIKERPASVEFGPIQINAMRTAAKIAKIAKLRFPTGVFEQNGKVTVNGMDLDCFDSFPVQPDYKGNINPYGVNVNYLLDAMEQANGGNIRLNSSQDSLLITNGDFTAVVMPCRL